MAYQVFIDRKQGDKGKVCLRNTNMFAPNDRFWFDLDEVDTLRDMLRVAKEALAPLSSPVWEMYHDGQFHGYRLVKK